MRIQITHKTFYQYDAPVTYGLQQLRMSPKSRPGQEVLHWDIEVKGGTKQLSFEDEHANTVQLISFDAGIEQLEIICRGEVDVIDNGGVIGQQRGFVPMWLFEHTTPMTRAGNGVRALVGAMDKPDDPLSLMHALSQHIHDTVPYSTQQTESDLSAEDVLKLGQAVCQDHAHVFIAAARHLGFPARYVSGYLVMDGQVEQDATHAWAEAHVAGLGWVGFDVSNEICPDDRYVRVATGLDYHGAAPVSGMRYGPGDETLNVKLQVQQQ